MASSTPNVEVRSPRYGFQSPNVRTRAHEKEELSDLNDRLANYISRMRQLEQNNARLTAEITTSKESVSREVSNVRGMYETELSDARRLIDESAKERAALKLEVEKLSNLKDDLQERLDKETAARLRAEDDLKHTERRLHDKELLAQNLAKERKALDIRCKELQSQLDALKDDLCQAKNQAEEELLRRVDVENRLQTLQEESRFNEQVRSKEISELRSSNEQIRYSMETTDGPSEYVDDLLREKLQELREEFEEEAEHAREELEQAYKSKFEDLQRMSDRERGHVTRLIEKNTEIKTELDKLRSDYGVLEAKNIQLNKQLNELEELRKFDKDDFRRQLRERDERINSLQDRIKQMEEEYETLLGIKLSLDLEISAYRKMLEGEEERLNIPSPTQRQSTGKRRGTKRSRPTDEDEVTSKSAVEQTADGNIEVIDCDLAGKFVKLHNKSNQDEALGGWYVQRVVNGQDDTAVEYKFTPKYVLKAGNTVTLWSTSAGVKQKAPSDLVLRNGESWPIGQSMLTSVINHEAEIVAKHNITQTIVRDESGGSRRQRKRRTGAERDSCAVM